MTDLLPCVLAKIGEVYQQRSDLILAMWPDIIGPKLAPMTQAISFSDGVLLVKVKNSTLHSLLNQNEKFRLLSLLRKKFPNVEIKNICFRIG
jgi:Dna[CI] antecedent, DciA